MSCSPSQRRFQFMSPQISTTSKARLRVNIPTHSTAVSPSPNLHANTELLMSFDNDTLYDPNTVFPSLSSASTPHSPPRLCAANDSQGDSAQQLINESHSNRLVMQETMVMKKGTQPSYNGHQKRYFEWWAADQDRRQLEDCSWQIVPAEPITVAKVALFLEYESKRSKRDNQGKSLACNSLLGHEHIKQCISALESLRRNHQHLSEYISDPLSQVHLRDDIRIKVFEENARATEPARIAQSQKRKAVGSSADTYTSEELMRASIACLINQRGPAAIHRAIRNRALFLFPTVTAFRGNNVRQLLWSDLFVRDIPLDDLGPGATLETLVCLVDQAKHNQTGRVDEHGALRHRDVELCAFAAVGLVLFSRFQITRQPIPDFSPNFENLDYGEFGERLWYRLLVFPSSRGEENEMSYDNHREIIKTIHEDNGIEVSKVTHAGRIQTPHTAREHGASDTSTKALGGWSDSGSFKAVYDRALPVDALLGAAKFNARKPETYCLPRSFLDPPAELTTMIFPWVEAEQQALEQRRKTVGPKAQDLALRQFLLLLQRFRRILLQDCAVLFTKYPACNVFEFSPFNTRLFRDFAATSAQLITEAEQQCRLRFQNLPEHMIASLQGVVQTNTLSTERDRSVIEHQYQHLSVQVQALTNVVTDLALARPSKRRRVGVSSVLSASLEPANPAASTSPLLLPSVTMPRDSSTVLSAPSGLLTPAIATIINPPSSITCFVSTASGVLAVLRDQFSEPQELAMKAIEKEFGISKTQNHHWDWIEPSGRIANDWVPRYTLKQNISRHDIWDEWISGLDGMLSVQQLESRWGTRWRSNSSALKTEMCRRRKLIDLVNELSRKPNWSIGLAFRFLDECYPIQDKKDSPSHLRSASLFCRYLQSTKMDAIQQIKDAAGVYSSR